MSTSAVWTWKYEADHFIFSINNHNISVRINYFIKERCKPFESDAQWWKVDVDNDESWEANIFSTTEKYNLKTLSFLQSEFRTQAKIKQNFWNLSSLSLSSNLLVRYKYLLWALTVTTPAFIVTSCRSWLVNLPGNTETSQSHSSVSFQLQTSVSWPDSVDNREGHLYPYLVMMSQTCDCDMCCLRRGVGSW